MHRRPLHRTRKETAVATIVEHIIQHYAPHKTPIVLMWRDVITSHELKIAPDHPARWYRDIDDVHRHWKQYGLPTAKVLREQYKLTVVKVNRHIRELVGHGKPPDQSPKKNPAAYERCLPSSSSPVFGMVLFPRDTCQDHPLIVLSRKRRCQTASSCMENSVNDVRATSDLGCLSIPIAQSIVEVTRAAVTRTFDAERYPLFRQLTP